MSDRSPQASTPTAKKPRCVSLGHTSGSTQPQRMGRATVALAVRHAARLAAVSDILERPQSNPAKKPSGCAILEGGSPDDAKAIRRLLKDQAKASQRVNVSGLADPNEQISADWRHSVYPYKNLLSRRVYETQKYQLPVELLKLQAWAKETAQRAMILFEGRDTAANGISSAMCSTCPPRVKL